MVIRFIKFLGIWMLCICTAILMPVLALMNISFTMSVKVDQ